MCAPNGARKMKDDHPEVPIGADDLADCAESIVDAGASLIHVHVRDPRGRHSLDTEEYRRVSVAIKDRVGEKLVVQVTTEACGIYSRYEQMAMVRDLKPEAISVAVREICPDAAAEAAGYRAVASATPLKDNQYKVQLAKVAVVRAILQAARLPTGGVYA